MCQKEAHRKKSVTSSVSNFCQAFTLPRDNRTETSSFSVVLSDFLLLGSRAQAGTIWIISKLYCQVIGLTWTRLPEQYCPVEMSCVTHI